MDEFPGRLADSWNGMSSIRRGMLTATGIGLVALLYLLYTWSQTTSYVPLYSGLDTADSGRIVDQLRSRGVLFEIDRSGSSIRVPESDVEELRLDFAAQGLPEGSGVGFELFDGNGFTLTDFAQRLNFQRGLQGELQRTIESFPAVERARVHIVMPERSLFVREQLPATASIVLGFAPGRSLAANEVQGVAHLVAGSVEGLEKSGITIINSSGAILFDGSELESDGTFGISSTQFALQRAFEQAIERDVQQDLDRALGPSKSVVSVRATLNFDRTETETETFLPADGDQLARSRTTTSETFTSSGTQPTSIIPGAVANVPGANANLPQPDTATTESSSDYGRTESTENFELSSTRTLFFDAPGDVLRLSVSLLLDESITVEQASALADSVSAAVGLDTDRGDTIVVNRLPFDTSAIDEALVAFETEASNAQLFSYIRIGLPVAVLLVAFIFFRLLMRSVSRRSYMVTDLPGGMQAALATAGGSPQMVAQATARVLPPPPPEEIKSDMELQVEKLAITHPETVTEVVQAWLRED